MKIVVVSDSHKEFHKLNSVVENNLDADAFIHLGDGEHEFNDVRNLHPEKSFLFVKGNCDFADNKTIRIANAKGIKILCVHGHEHHVHQGLDTLIAVAKQNGCKIALYGHTHLYRTELIDGIYVMNPGSIDSPRDKRPPSYGIITIDDDGVIYIAILVLFLRLEHLVNAIINHLKLKLLKVHSLLLLDTEGALVVEHEAHGT